MKKFMKELWKEADELCIRRIKCRGIEDELEKAKKRIKVLEKCDIMEQARNIFYRNAVEKIVEKKVDEDFGYDECVIMDFMDEIQEEADRLFKVWFIEHNKK